MKNEGNEKEIVRLKVEINNKNISNNLNNNNEDNILVKLDNKLLDINRIHPNYSKASLELKNHFKNVMIKKSGNNADYNSVMNNCKKSANGGGNGGGNINISMPTRPKGMN
jgi:hypothetical protein